MNTHRILSVMLILAMVATLCVVAATPASAAVTATSIVPAPTTAGATNTTTTFNFTAGAVATNVSIVLPGSTMTLATAGVVPVANITVDAAPTATAATWTAATNTLLITAPITAAAHVIILTSTATDYLVNPAAGGPIAATIGTSAEAAVPATYNIFGAGSAAVAVSPATAGLAAQYTITMFTKVAAATGDVLSITLPAGTTVPTTISYTAVRVGLGATTAAAVTNLTAYAAADAAPMVTGNTVMVPITATQFAAGAVGVGAYVQVVISQLGGIVNPSIGGSLYTVAITSTNAGEIASTSAAYTIGRAVSFSPTAGPTGTPVTITGSGFAASRSIDITGAVVGAGTTNADGTFSVTGAASTTTGTVTATDGAGNATTTAGNFTVTPKLTLTPASGLVRTSITITATGLAVGTYVVTVADVPTSFVSATVGTLNTTAGTSYSIPAGTVYNTVTSIAGATSMVAVVRIPAATTAGPKTIALRSVTAGGAAASLAAFQAVTASSSGIFTVDARTATLTPATGQSGTTVVVTGAGFEASVAGTPVTVNATFTSSTGTTTTGLFGAAGAAVSGTGTFSASFAIPAASSAGTGVLTVTSYIAAAAQSTATGYFTVLPAGLTVSPASGGPGSMVTLSGTGYTPYSTLTGITIDGVANTVVLVPSVIVAADGTFTSTFTWPSLAAGIHTVVMGGTTAIGYFTQGAVAIAVTSGLQSVAGKYAKVWSFDGATQEWKLYDTAEGATSTLSTMERGQGYWIQATEAATIIYSGNTYSLSAGWNLIGWLG